MYLTYKADFFNISLKSTCSRHGMADKNVELALNGNHSFIYTLYIQV